MSKRNLRKLCAMLAFQLIVSSNVFADTSVLSKTYFGLTESRQICTITLHGSLGFVEFRIAEQESWTFLFSDRVSMNKVMSSKSHRTLLLSKNNCTEKSSQENTLMLLFTKSGDLCFAFLQELRGFRSNNFECRMLQSCD